MTDKKKIICIIAFSTLGLITAGALFYGGYYIGFSQTRLIRIEGVADIYPGDETAADFGVFWQAWDKIKERHLRSGTLSAQEMIHGAIKGLAESAGDPHTTFFSPEDASKFTENIDGRFGGIGAELEEINNQIIVVTPLKGTPAERAGLRPRDTVIKADGIELAGKTVQDAIRIIRGEPGTEVNLVISREGDVGTRNIQITREMITLPTVEWEWKDGDVAYVRLISFNQNAPFAFYNVIREFIAENPRAMILDLRNNPGGYLEVAVNLAGWFIDRGEVVVKERYADGEDRIFRSHGNAALRDLPIIILVNGGTTSAAEIMAGAIRDINGTRLVGERTFGKGTVQTLERLKDGSMLKITVANWVTPDGHIIEGSGLIPDINVKAEANNEEDLQLNKALELLRNN